MSRFALGLAALTLVLVTGACEDDPEPKIADPTEEPTSEITSDPPTSSASPEPVRFDRSRPFEPGSSGHRTWR